MAHLSQICMTGIGQFRYLVPAKANPDERQPIIFTLYCVEKARGRPDYLHRPESRSWTRKQLQMDLSPVRFAAPPFGVQGRVVH